MSTAASVVSGQSGGADRAPRIATIFAFSAGVIVTNLFAPQTLVGLIGPSIGLTLAQCGLVAMASMLGYAAGLFLLVPLADLVETRRLVVTMVLTAAMAATVVALAATALLLLGALFVLGAACSAIQILVPAAAAMAPPDRRGSVIGNVMAGVMTGILLSRPLASIVADNFGWRTFYGTGATAMICVAAVLAYAVPRTMPESRMSYPALIGSMWELFRSEPKLRRRALTAGLVMAAFSLYWTSVALRLEQSPFYLDQKGIAIFALMGVAGVAATPIVGWFGDKGWTRHVTIASHVVLTSAFALASGADWLPAEAATSLLVPMGAGAILLDVGLTGDQILGRRTVALLNPIARGRLNALFVGLFFLGGAAGSTLAGLAWTSGGWPLVCVIGAACGISALIVDLSEAASGASP
jgi:predicted MFS family arabinose efflux permease